MYTDNMHTLGLNDACLCGFSADGTILIVEIKCRMFIGHILGQIDNHGSKQPRAKEN